MLDLTGVGRRLTGPDKDACLRLPINAACAISRWFIVVSPRLSDSDVFLDYTDEKSTTFGV